MLPRKSLSGASARGQHTRAADEDEKEAFEFISAAVERMDQQCIALFRANLGRHAGSQELLAFVDEQLAQRGRNAFTTGPSEF